MSINRSETGVPPPAPDLIREALDKVVASEAFDGATRLQEFLRYVVEARIDDRRDKIPAKQISEDVYERPGGTGIDNENVVRVDAGRLRRRLKQYYLDDGKDEPIRIHIDPGGYVPRFELRDTDLQVAKSHPRKASWVAATTVAIGAVLLVALAAIRLADLHGDEVPQSTEANDKRILERQAIREKSPESLQAVNLAEQARGLIFPIFDRERVQLTTDMFRQVIRMDPQYFGGYAGAAQTLAVQAFLQPAGPEREALQAEAQQLADKAFALAPTDPWSQSAAAWVSFAGQDFDRARTLSNRARELSPLDGHVADFDALISLFTGNFQLARDTANPQRRREAGNARLVNRNIFGAASYHLGEYDATIRSLNTAAGNGEPISGLALVYLAAAHQALGETEMAARHARQLSEVWPEFRADTVLYRIFRERSHADAILQQLQLAGWSPAEQNALHTAPQ